MLVHWDLVTLTSNGYTLLAHSGVWRRAQLAYLTSYACHIRDVCMYVRKQMESLMWRCHFSYSYYFLRYA
jgi:hypothetical protein